MTPASRGIEAAKMDNLISLSNGNTTKSFSTLSAMKRAIKSCKDNNTKCTHGFSRESMSFYITF